MDHPAKGQRPNTKSVETLPGKGNQMKISLESYHFLIDTFSIIYFSMHGVNQFVYYYYYIFALTSLTCFLNDKMNNFLMMAFVLPKSILKRTYVYKYSHVL